MSTIRVPQTGTIEERLRRLEQANNFGEEIFCHSIVDEAGAATSLTTMTIMGGWTIPWDLFRPLLPDDRWVLSACGWINNPAGCALQLTYQKNDLSQVVIGQQNFATPFGWSKLRIGPFAARGDIAVATLPQDEAIHSWNLHVAATSGTVSLKRWTMWMRMSPRQT